MLRADRSGVCVGVKLSFISCSDSVWGIQGNIVLVVVQALRGMCD